MEEQAMAVNIGYVSNGRVTKQIMYNGHQAWIEDDDMGIFPQKLNFDPAPVNICTPESKSLRREPLGANVR